MIKEIDGVSLENLHNWWQSPPHSLVSSYGKSTLLEDIAFAICENDLNWVSFLNDYAYSSEIEYRAVAIYFLASKKNANPNIQKILEDAFYTNIIELQIASLQGMINIGIYPLKKDDPEFSNITNNTVAAWGMTYLCYAYPSERIKTLKKAMQSSDPRMREFACDVIGDEFIQELKPDLKNLLTDKNSIVTDAANYNYYEMLD